MTSCLTVLRRPISEFANSPIDIRPVMPRIVVSEPAQHDITEILIWSLNQFGDLAAERYLILIATAFDRLQADPSPIGSRTHPDIPVGYRMLHLQFCTKAARTDSGIVKMPRHCRPVRPYVPPTLHPIGQRQLFFLIDDN